jgi:hypothetical protein
VLFLCRPLLAHVFEGEAHTPTAFAGEPHTKTAGTEKNRLAQGRTLVQQLNKNVAPHTVADNSPSNHDAVDAQVHASANEDAALLDMGCHEEVLLDAFADFSQDDLASLAETFALFETDAEMSATEGAGVHQNLVADDNAMAEAEDDALDFLDLLDDHQLRKGEAASSSSAPHPSPVVDPIPGAAEDPLALVAELQLGQAGYVYLRGRHVLRIQRGKPANSVTVNCYRHPGCILCIRQHKCPDDDTLPN